MKHYIMIQKSCDLILGTGRAETEEQAKKNAIADTEYWLNASIDPESKDLLLVPCTQYLFYVVNLNGGDVHYYENEDGFYTTDADIL